MRKLVWLVLLVLVAVGGAVLAAIEIDRLLQFHEISQWPTVNGLVVQSDVVGERAIHPVIVYEYIVDSVSYRSESSLRAPMFGGKRKKYDVARELVEEYPVGRVVTVHYNPDSPDESTIPVSAPWNVYGQLALGVTLCVAGLFGLLWPLRSIRRQSRPQV